MYISKAWCLLMRMFLISDNVDTKTGMRLAGVEGVVVHERNEIEEALNSAIKDESIGIILITELLAQQVEDLIRDYKVNHGKSSLLRFRTGMAPGVLQTTSCGMSTKR